MATLPLKVAVVGLGGAGRNQAQAYHVIEGIELVGAADSNPEAALVHAEKLGLTSVYTDYRQLLAELKPDIVGVATPNSLHSTVTVDALNAGAHVLCEKPMATSVAEAQAMVDAAERNNRKLGVIYNWRYRPELVYLNQVIQSGGLGDIYHADVQWRRESGIPGSGWFGNKALAGGGALIDLGVHVLDLALWLMGFPKVETVSAQTRAEFGVHGKKIWGAPWKNVMNANAVRPTFDVDDGSVAFMRLANQASLMLQATWAEHRKPGDDFIQVELQGTQGSAYWKLINYRETEFRLYNEINGAAVTTIPNVITTETAGHERVVQEFVASVIYDRPLVSSGAHGFMGVQVLEAMYTSSATRREVVLV